MKRFSLFFLLAAGLLIGCKEQSVNPIVVDPSSATKQLKFSGMIKNAGVPDFPGNAEVRGTVQYTLRREFLSKSAARIVNLDAETEAEVRVPATDVSSEATYNTAGKSLERIQLNEAGSAMLSLAYRIEGSEAIVYLHLAFAADESQLRFHKAWISSTYE